MKIPRWMLNDEVQVEPYSGSGAYGPVYENTVTESARIQNSKERTIDDDGNEVVSNTKLFFRPESVVNVNAKVTFDGETYTVNDLNRYQGLSTESHLEAILL